MAYLDDLIRDCRRAQQARPDNRISIETFDDLPDALRGITRGIYIFSLPQTSAPEEIRNRFRAFKDQGQWACPRINENHTSTTLYVGSTRRNLLGRLKQHLGRHNSRKTYALNLERWLDQPYTLEILEYQIEDSVLQLVEDALWHDLQPLFGKPGANGR